MKTTLIAAAFGLVTLAGALAQEKPVTLKPGAGHDTVENNCGVCHSLDYVATNSSFLDRKGWEAEVNKMINAFGAPIAPEDAKSIVDYLAKSYGTGG